LSDSLAVGESRYVGKHIEFAWKVRTKHLQGGFEDYRILADESMVFVGHMCVHGHYSGGGGIGAKR
jgi:hypothetical protein